MSRFAKVRLLTSLPNLDKEFDYKIPESIDLSFGMLVDVPFGKSGSKKGIVVGLAAKSDYADKVQEIREVLARNSLLTREQLELAELLAARYAGSVGELLADMIPKVSKKVDLAWQQSNLVVTQPETQANGPTLNYQQLGVNSPTSWAKEFLLDAKAKFDQGKSTLIILPDYRDLEILEQEIGNLNLEAFTVRHTAIEKASSIYVNYLKSMSNVAIHYGLRSACLKPIYNLGGIYLFDDADESHLEIGSPYWNSRDVLLLRQQLHNCDFVIASFSPSADVVRLVEIGFLNKKQQVSSVPIVRCNESANRLDDETFGLISATLRKGEPVLIQTANLGFASSLTCASCKQPRICPSCESRIWIDPTGTSRCRSCKFIGKTACSCGHEQVRVTRTGSTAMQNWLQKAFPNNEIIHSTASERITQINSGAKVVIATPGAEPHIEGGYSLLVLADAGFMLGNPSLRATEKACSAWANACSKVSARGVIIFVGLSGEICESLRQLDFYGIVSNDAKEREDLQLPPATRLGSIVSSDVSSLENLRDLLVSGNKDLLRFLPSSDPKKLVFIYPYRVGIELAKELSNLTQELSKKVKSNRSNLRVFKIVMDDWNAI